MPEQRDNCPGEIGDDQVPSNDSCVGVVGAGSSQFSTEEEVRFAYHFKEGYVLFDPRYESDLKCNHPENARKATMTSPSIVTTLSGGIPPSTSCPSGGALCPQLHHLVLFLRSCLFHLVLFLLPHLLHLVVFLLPRLLHLVMFLCQFLLCSSAVFPVVHYTIFLHFPPFLSLENVTLKGLTHYIRVTLIGVTDIDRVDYQCGL